MIKVNTLLHKERDFVGVVTQVDERRGVYVAYYKWMPYSNPDNKSGGMSGWYRVEEMEQYVTTAEDRIFKQYGLPPEYNPIPHIIEKRVRELAEAHAWQTLRESEAGGSYEDIQASLQELVDYVMEQIDNA